MTHYTEEEVIEQLKARQALTDPIVDSARDFRKKFQDGSLIASWSFVTMFKAIQSLDIYEAGLAAEKKEEAR